MRFLSARSCLPVWNTWAPRTARSSPSRWVGRGCPPPAPHHPRASRPCCHLVAQGSAAYTFTFTAGGHVFKESGPHTQYSDGAILDYARGHLDPLSLSMPRAGEWIVQHSRLAVARDYEAALAQHQHQPVAAATDAAVLDAIRLDDLDFLLQDFHRDGEDLTTPMGLPAPASSLPVMEWDLLTPNNSMDIFAPLHR